MTLRARLLSLTLSMVAVVVLTLVALNVKDFGRARGYFTEVKTLAEACRKCQKQCGNTKSSEDPLY